MSFVYVLIFMVGAGGNEDGVGALELKEYSTYEACIRAARMAKTEHRSKRYPNAARGNYHCVAKPA